MKPTSKAVSTALVLVTLWSGAAGAQALRRNEDAEQNRISVGTAISAGVVITVASGAGYYTLEQLDTKDLHTRHLVREQEVLESGSNRSIPSNFSIVDESLKHVMPGDVVTITNRPQTPGALAWAVQDLAASVQIWEDRVAALKSQQAEFEMQRKIAETEVKMLPFDPDDIERIRKTASYKRLQDVRDKLRLTKRAVADAEKRFQSASKNFNIANTASETRPLGVKMSPDKYPELTYDLLVDKNTGRQMDSIFGHQYGGIQNASEIPVELRVTRTKTPNVSAKRLAITKARGGIATLAVIGGFAFEEVFVHKLRDGIDASLGDQPSPETRTVPRNSTVR